MNSTLASTLSKWSGCAILAGSLLAPLAAQVNYSEAFDVNIAGWSVTGGFQPNYYADGTACGGAGGALRTNLYLSAPSNVGTFLSPLLGVSLGGTTTLTFDYKVATYNSGNVAGAPAPFGSIDVQYGSTAVGPWTSAGSFADEAQTGSCIGKLFAFAPAPGDVYIRFVGTRTGGDNWWSIDNVVVSENTGACSGTPTPGDTIGPMGGACPGSNFQLSLQNATSGSGVDYQWYVSTASNTGPWTLTGGNAATLVTSQAVTSWYYCDVTCTAGPSTGASNVVQVNAATTAFPQDFSGGVINPNCWSAEALVGVSSPVYSTVSAFGSGTGAARFNFYAWSTPREVALTSPSFAPVAGGTQIYFDVAGRTYVGGEIDQIVLEESNDSGTTWTPVVTMTNEPGVGVLATLGANSSSYTPAAGDWASLAYTLSAGTNRVRFHGISDYGNDVYLDNISVGAMPSAAHTTYGTGCGSPAFAMTASPAPISGTSFLYDLPNVPLACPSPDPVFHFGFVMVSFGQDIAGTDLLAGYGIESPGCRLHVTSLDVLLSYVDSIPNQTVALDIPMGAPAGAVIFSQAVALICPEAPNNAGVVTSNGVRSYINSF